MKTPIGNIQVECNHCGYSWIYSGQHRHPAKIQCMACRKLFPISEKHSQNGDKVI